ncbi:MAG: sortase [Candidatus Nomurabacteria bacterium]|jgi:sortase A|nr:sortase [Candidatus Nomurabacteria bacterium]
MNPLKNDNEDKLRAASANVARHQINRIFNVDERAKTETSSRAKTEANSRFLSHSNRVIQPLEAKTELKIERHEQSKQPEQRKIERVIAEQKEVNSDKENKETAEMRAAYAQYHNSWQQYYQKYYERYYVNAVAQKNHELNQKISEVEAKGVNSASSPTDEKSSETLSQKEAVDELRNDLRSRIRRAGQKVRKSRHFVPAICAIVVVIIAAFIQYNQLLFAQVNAFISPGSMTDQDIIVGTGADQPVGQDPRVIIPKINVSAPVIYDLNDWSEAGSQEALRRGVIHYPIQGANARPGQNGNTVILGHSSSDWFSPGDYKFIFVQLNRLVAGDLFYLEYQGVRYTYRVTRTEVIEANEVNKLAIGTDKPYATLITCDPPGTALRRLAVFAEQISPDPTKATASQNGDESVDNDHITGNPPTLFEQLFNSLN